MKQTRTRQITAREIMDQQGTLLRFVKSDIGISYTDGFLQDEYDKWKRGKIPTRGLLADLMRNCLVTASPYYVTSEVQDIILATARMRDSMQYDLAEHQLITPSGFLVFEKQFYLRDGRGYRCGIKAITWRTASVTATSDPNARGEIVDIQDSVTGHKLRGVEVMIWSDVRDPTFKENDDWFNIDDESANKALTFIGKITQYSLLAYKGMIFGKREKAKGNQYEVDGVEVGAYDLGDDFMQGQYDGTVKLDGDTINRLKREQDMFLVEDLFIASIMVMNQKVAGIAGVHADRAATKRFKREGITAPSMLNIVTLRRLLDRGKFFPDETEAEDVNWSHRWWVKGHWRFQYYPSRNEHEWIYIEPHVKGPDHLPVILKPDVYFVER